MMERPGFVLAAMAAAGAERRFDPVRLQKYFFLLDRELEGECGCPHFDFQPYRYGPFDQAVYRQVERLVLDGLAVVDERRPYRVYGLDAQGLERSAAVLARMPERARRYMAAASNWVFSLDFRELLASVYEYAPDMAVESVMPEAAIRERSKDRGSPFLRGMARAFDWTGATERTDCRRAGAEALRRQWGAVGGYLRDAMNEEGAPFGASAR